MNEILISIKPKYCELIALGKKIIEIRKTRPKMPTPFKVFVYCTKGNIHEALMFPAGDRPVKIVNCFNYKTAIPIGGYICNGKVIGEFVCNGVLIIPNINGGYCITHEYLKETALKHRDLDKYGKGQKLYGWHISDFALYSKPRELNELCKITKLKNGFEIEQIERAPQSWCYLTREG